MICPDCGYDNIEGVDGCEQCGQPLVDFDPSTCELEESISRHSIAVLAPKPAVCISAETTVREAVQTMAQKNIGCLLVKEAEQLAGVFTERDVLNRISQDLSALDEPVSNYMTRSPETIRRQDSIAYALHADGYRRLPAHGGRRSLWNADGHPLRPRHPPLFVRAVCRDSHELTSRATDWLPHGRRRHAFAAAEPRDPRDWRILLAGDVGRPRVRRAACRRGC